MSKVKYNMEQARWELKDDKGNIVDTAEDSCTLCERNNLGCSFIDEEYGGPHCDILS